MVPKTRIYVSTSVDNHLNPKLRAIKQAILHAIQNEEFEPQEFATSGIPSHMAFSFMAANDVMSRCQG